MAAYPSPNKDKEFKKYWNKLLPKVIERDNFHESHLEQLHVLCDLYVDYHKLTLFLREKGYTYETDGRYGENHREYPEVKIQQKCIAEIRQYCRVLDLLLTKDLSRKENPEEETWK